jgi:hypothetical protein
MSHRTISIETCVRSPRCTDHDDLEQKLMQCLNLTDDDYNIWPPEMEPIEIERQDIMWSWQDTSFDFIDRYNKIVVEMTGLFKDVENTKKYIADLKIPFCWEYTKLAYSRKVEELLLELTAVDIQILTFPSDLDFHQKMSIERANKNLSEVSMNYLENILGFYADRISTISEDLKCLQTNGMDVAIESQKLSTNCGY